MGKIPAMRKNEHGIFYRAMLYNTLLVALLGLATIPPVKNWGTTNRVMTALITGERIDCAQGVSPLNKDYPFDSIVIPLGGFEQDFTPNKVTRKRLLAGAVAYLDGKAKDVVIQNGISPTGADPDIVLRYFMAYVKVVSNFEKEINESHIRVDKNHINTSTGMLELKENDKQSGEKKYLVISSKSHIDRAVADGCDIGMAMTGESAEELVAMVDPNQAIINAKGHTPPFWITFKEETELISNMYYPGGGLTVPLKRASLKYKESQTGPELGHYFPLLIIILFLMRKKNLRKNYTAVKN